MAPGPDRVSAWTKEIGAAEILPVDSCGEVAIRGENRKRLLANLTQGVFVNALWDDLTRYAQAALAGAEGGRVRWVGIATDFDRGRFGETRVINPVVALRVAGNQDRLLLIVGGGERRGGIVMTQKSDSVATYWEVHGLVNYLGMTPDGLLHSIESGDHSSELAVVDWDNGADLVGGTKNGFSEALTAFFAVGVGNSWTAAIAAMKDEELIAHGIRRGECVRNALEAGGMRR